MRRFTVMYFSYVMRYLNGTRDSANLVMTDFFGITLKKL